MTPGKGMNCQMAVLREVFVRMRCAAWMAPYRQMSASTLVGSNSHLRACMVFMDDADADAEAHCLTVKLYVRAMRQPIKHD